MNYKEPDRIVKKILFYIIGLFIILVPSQVKAQAGTDWSGPWAIGVGLGTTSYIGDLNEHNENRALIIPQSLSFAGSGWFSKGFGPVTAVVQMNLGRLQSRDYVINQMFRSNFYEYSGKLRLNVNQILKGRRYRLDKWHVYTQAGLGMVRFSSYLTDISETNLIDNTGYAAISKATSVDIGIGLQYYMTDEANLHIGVDYHFLNSDEIDAKAKGVANDSYLYMSIGFSYSFTGGGLRGRRSSATWGRY